MNNLKDRDCVICLQSVGYDIHGAAKQIRERGGNIEDIDLESPEMLQFRLNTFMRTPCNHAFHVKCLIPWLDKDNRSCPICRTNLPLYESI